jgi:hypothetical protein
MFAAFENRYLRYLVLWCMGSVDKTYREKEHDATRDDSNRQLIAYKLYMANNGVKPLMMEREQADYLNTFSADAQLFYLAFAFVDGSSIDNGIARHILSYIGDTLDEGDEKKRELEEKIDYFEEMIKKCTRELRQVI